MALTDSDVQPKFSPFHAVLQNGIDRLLELLQPQDFSFVVKGEHFKSTLAEDVLISPIISECLKSDPTLREFYFPTDSLDPTLFSLFLDLIRSRCDIKFSLEHELDFLSVCKLLGNEQLGLILLRSVHSDRISDTKKSEEVLPPSIVEYDDCASQFASYSTDELGCLSKETLHGLLSSTSLAIESEDVLLQTLIDLGSDYFEFWCYLEISFLSDEGISRFVDSLRFDDLNATIWSKIVFRLQGICDCEFRSRRCCSRRTSSQSIFESKIISVIPVPLKRFEEKEWVLLYRGTRDGFEGSTFHAKCDGQGNTVTFILTTKGFIFGGFTPISWDSSNAYKQDTSQQSFLFSIKNPHKSEPRSFPLVNSTYAICCYSSYGPTFGGGTDLYVANRCNNNTSSSTYLGYSYRNDTGLNNAQVFTGEQHFQVQEIEVFSITL
jgi:hypothetical protein